MTLLRRICAGSKNVSSVWSWEVSTATALGAAASSLRNPATGTTTEGLILMFVSVSSGSHILIISNHGAE